MIGRMQRGGNGDTHFVTVGQQEMPIREGASIKVKMHDTWMRGRFEVDHTGGDEQPVLNAGDRKFVIPEGSDIEIV